MLVIELHSCAPISVFVLAKKQGGLLLEAHENYQKKSHRNRIQLASSLGVATFSIPLQKGKANQSKIKDVKISYEEDWARKLSHMLLTNYSGAAYFDYYFEELIHIFHSRIEGLWTLNYNLLSWIIKSARIDINVDESKGYNQEYSSGYYDARNRGLSFYQNYTSKELEEYDQIFISEVGFLRNLSIIDLIMNKGPESGILITEWANRI